MEEVFKIFSIKLKLLYFSKTVLSRPTMYIVKIFRMHKVILNPKASVYFLAAYQFLDVIAALGFLFFGGILAKWL